MVSFLTAASNLGLGGILILALLAIFLQAIWNAYLHPLRNIPGPRAARLTRLWLLDQSRRGNAHLLYPDLHRRYGPIVRVAPYKISLADPAWIPSVYGFGASWHKSTAYIPFENDITGKRAGNIFSTRDSTYHKRMRSTVSSAYSLTSLRQLEPMVDEVTDLFHTLLREMSGQTLDFGEWLQWYAFDVIGNITFSKTFGFLETQSDRNNVIANLEDGIAYVSVISQWPFLHYLLLENRFLLRFLMNFHIFRASNPTNPIRAMIDEAMVRRTPYSNKGARKDYLSFLRSVQEASSLRLSDTDIIDSLAVNLFAGSDTTAMGFRAVLYLIVKHPRVYRKLQQEIDQADSSGRLSEFVQFSEAAEMTYLLLQRQAVIKEALRVHPGVSMLMERVVPHTGHVFGEARIPSGVNVGMSAWVVNYNQDIFGADASSFRPERWLESDTTQLQRMDRSFLSFGAGARTCLGKNISLMELNKFVPQLLRHFDLEWASEAPEWRIKGLWFAKQSGMQMKLIERTKSEIK